MLFVVLSFVVAVFWCVFDVVYCGWLLFVVCCLTVVDVVCCLVFVECCLLTFVLLYVVGWCLLFVGCCVLYVVVRCLVEFVV